MIMHLLAATALTIAGCSSSSSIDAPNFSELSNAFDALNTSIDALPLTDPMPQGSSTYSGLVRVDYVRSGDPSVMVGDAALTADFRAATVDGALSRFVHDSEGAVDGRIALTGGTITGPRIDGIAIDGSLEIGGESVDFDGSGRGQFKGADAEAGRLELFGSGGGPTQPDGWYGNAYLQR
jgi:hypothetical protein